MAGDGDESQSLSARVGTIEGRINALESTLGGVVQGLKRLSFKINVQNLANDMYRNGRDCSSINLLPPPPSHPP